MRYLLPGAVTIIASALALGGAVLVRGTCAAADTDSVPARLHVLTYTIIPDSSRVHVHTNASGLFSFAGHEHDITMSGLTGTVSVDSTDLSRLELVVQLPAAELEVVDPDHDVSTRAKIQKTMEEEVLETELFPLVTFRGTRLEIGERAAVPAAVTGQLGGVLGLHGIDREITVPLEIEIDDHRLRARGSFSIRHRDHRLKRIKVLRVVNVAERIDITFDVQGGAAPSDAGS